MQSSESEVKFSDSPIADAFKIFNSFIDNHQPILRRHGHGLPAALWVTLWRAENRFEGTVRIGMSKLAEKLGTHKSSVKRAMDVAVALGYVEVVQPGIPGRNGECAIYALHLPNPDEVLSRVAPGRRPRGVPFLRAEGKRSPGVNDMRADARTCVHKETFTSGAGNVHMAHGNVHMAHEKRSHPANTSVLCIQSSSGSNTGCPEMNSGQARDEEQDQITEPEQKTKDPPPG